MITWGSFELLNLVKGFKNNDFRIMLCKGIEEHSPNAKFTLLCFVVHVYDFFLKGHFIVHTKRQGCQPPVNFRTVCKNL